MLFIRIQWKYFRWVPQSKIAENTKSWPPVHLLHSINQYCVMEKMDLFAMKERDLQFNKTVKFSLSVANLRNQATIYSNLDIYLRHTLIILSGSFIDLVPSHSDSIFLNFFSSVTIDFKISSALRWSIQDQWSSGLLLLFFFFAVKQYDLCLWPYMKKMQ